MTEEEAEVEIPHIQVDLDVDPLQADLQLQRTLQLNASRSESNSSALLRKHSRDSSSEFEFESSSDVSGRFDDAEESDPEQRKYEFGAIDHSPSAHSSKRRRSNDWPLQEGGGGGDAYSEQRRRINDGRKISYGGLPRTSAASSRGGRQGGPVNGGRRSRFVEASMNDSVSERPPSIFIREDVRTDERPPNHTNAAAAAATAQRQSGIFRFGKAIASAFNPFGVWGNVSDIWKGPPDANRQQDDALNRAEKAYAELKKSGYTGTVKGSYMQQAGLESNPADQTWKASQDRMDYGPSRGHSRQNSRQSSSGMAQTEGRNSVSSVRSSFHDLRKARSVLGIPSINRSSEDSERTEVRKQKSRKDLLKQEKLLKKVSNLEEKLERVRRELRELTGEDEMPVRSMCLDTPAYPRKFVPGALPSLPSERLLDQQAEGMSGDPDPTAAKTPSRKVHRSIETTENVQRDRGTRRHPSASKSPAAANERIHPLANDSPSRKRKSPDPPAHRKPTPSHPTKKSDHDDAATEAVTPARRSKSRRSKLQKQYKGDSPGSVERKQSERHFEAENDAATAKKSRYLKPSQSPSNPKSKSSTPCLRMKRAKSDLRAEHVDDGERTDALVEDEKRQNEVQPQNFYLQSDYQLDPNESRAETTPSPGKGWDFSYGENIPPVPPLPRDLVANAAKVDKGLVAKGTESNKRDAHRKNVRARTRGQAQRAADDDFQWPDDIF